jgi:hypothetical protein
VGDVARSMCTPALLVETGERGGRREITPAARECSPDDRVAHVCGDV